ncbi:hypothetical protein PR048_031923 [Dryococelus australis]|uniref:Peptidase A2 domain-containing protein n=1 Tax=Dryococelus australis TaxID=614101 RepID=A0ABQ9G6M3_9NEOP|nr:hypothetical protein PR048_031923 [Dryococelus australis]
MVPEVRVNFMPSVVDFDVPNQGKLGRTWAQPRMPKKIGILMTSVREKGVQVFNTLSLIDESTYDEPKKNTVYEWYLVSKIRQSEGITFDLFLIELKTQATFCEFGKEKDNLIRDTIVFGVNDPTLTELMLQDSALTLNKAEDLCQIYEASKLQTVDIHESGKPGPSLVETIKTTEVCEFSHEYRRCPAYNKQCRTCKGMNHFEAVCKKSAAAVNGVSNVGSVEEGYDDQCSWYMPSFIGKQSVTDKIDSGAQTKVLSLKTVESLSPNPKIFPSQTSLVTYSRPVGKVLLETRCNNKCLLVNFEVVAGDVECILGLKSPVQLELI